MNEAIIIKNLKKKYNLGVINNTTLQRQIQSKWAKLKGKEDPNLRIGSDSRLIGKEFWALNGINLTINKGEAIGIIGNNGAGKSTLLKLICQISAPTEGSIELFGRVTSMLEVGTGFHGEMTGRENIYMNGAILGMSKKEIDEKLDKIIEFSEVGEFIDTPVKRYSSGMFVKLAFAVSAHLNSEIVIMDEVLAVGDMAFQNKCLNKMKEVVSEEGRTILYVSHNMETIRRLCSRCIVLSEGKIIYDGDVDKAISIYMNSALKENEVDKDLSHTLKVNKGLIMSHFTLVDKSVPNYNNAENLVFKLTFKVTKKLDNVCLRLTIRDSSNVGIGTSFSSTFNIEEGTYTKTFILPLNNIAKGNFYGSIGFYTRDELGRLITLDHITRVFRFEVNGEPYWNNDAYGYMYLPSIEVKD